MCALGEEFEMYVCWFEHLVAYCILILTDVQKMCRTKAFNFNCGAFVLVLLLHLHLCKGQTRTKRFLIFPRQAPTRHQFIAGIGIPADLEYEALTVGYVLKAQFFLPYNATVYRQNPFWPEYKETPTQRQQTTRFRRYHDSALPLRWHLYQYLESRLKGYGYNGDECVLQSICEANAVRFEVHSNIFSELLHIFFTPTTSLDKELPHVGNYFEAERTGRTGGPNACDIYDCNWSLLNWITHVHSGIQ